MPIGGVPEKQTARYHWMKIFLCGICMGAADIVPGISGGTVAFLLGIYPELLKSLNSFSLRFISKLASFRFAEAFQEVQWKFLLFLVGGIAFSFVAISQFFTELLQHEVYRVYLYSGFLGLIIASLWFCARQIEHWRVNHVVCLAAGALCAYFFTQAAPGPAKTESLYHVSLSLPPSDKKISNYSPQEGLLLNIEESAISAMVSKGVITEGTIVTELSTNRTAPVSAFPFPRFTGGLSGWFIFCGAIAVSAMLLPGVSGSYLLGVLGAYSVVIGALADFIAGVKTASFDADAFSILASTFIGIMGGAVVFSRVVSWLLRDYRELTLSLLTGFMIGALRSVWPFWTYAYEYLPLKLDKGPVLFVVDPMFPEIYTPLFLHACLFAAAGFSLVFLLESMASPQKAGTSAA